MLFGITPLPTGHCRHAPAEAKGGIKYPAGQNDLIGIDPDESRPSDSDIDSIQTVNAGPLVAAGKGPQTKVIFTEFDVRFAGNLTIDKPDDCGGVKRHASV